jgi:hypothetical protein
MNWLRRLKAKWERAMQNLTQMLMQQWGCTAERRVMNREAMLLSTSAMMAMLLVGCESGESQRETMEKQIDFLIKDDTTAQQFYSANEAPMVEDHPYLNLQNSNDDSDNIYFGGDINTKDDFLTAVQSHDEGVFYYQYKIIVNVGEEEKINSDRLLWEKAIVKPQDVEGLYFLSNKE